MKLAWATDLHLTAAEPGVEETLCEEIGDSRAEALLLGGDVAESPFVVGHLRMLADRVSCPIYFVLGNHEYYGSSVAAVRAGMRRLRHPRLHWLAECGCVALTARTALVGHGGWADARLGDFARAPLLTDFLAIDDLARHVDRDDLLEGFRHRDALQRQLRELGDDAARSLRPALLEAAERFDRVLVLTHVPPFARASFYAGGISGDDWLPLTTCKAVGDLLSETASTHAHVHFRVLCGHTHGEGHAWLAPNLEVRTGGAEVGHPRFSVFDAE